MEEEFEHEGARVRQVPGHPDYFISDTGVVWTKKGRNGWKWREDKSVLQKRKPWLDRYGYKRLSLRTNGARHWVTVHGLVLLAFRGPCPEGGQCRHLDGNKLNNNLSNLRWGTLKENMADKFRHGTMPRGEQLNRGVLTDEIVKEIRKRYASGTVRMAQLGEEYGISKSHVWDVVHRTIWKHVE